MIIPNVELQEGFTQVCVWPATLTNSRIDEFVEFMKETFDIRVQYLEEIETAPDIDISGYIIEGTGGRNDLFFAIHRDDIGKFAGPRFDYGIRWIEDVYSNGKGYLYPDRISDYKSW